MGQFVDYWENIYKERFDKEVVFDTWLDKYAHIIEPCKTQILDLGCGLGSDTLYLTLKGHSVLSCDYSKTALKKIDKYIPNSQTMLMDMEEKFKFEDNSFDVIIADQSLHYFDDATTKALLQEIKRVLKPNGNLIARVNSTKSLANFSGQTIKLEQNYYFVEGCNRRFFNKDDVQKYFSILGEPVVVETSVTRYDKPRQTLEIAVTNKK